MLQYVIRQVLRSLPVIGIALVLTFMYIRLIPGDPAQNFLGPGATLDQVEAMRAYMGISDPIHVQLTRWLGGVARGDLGNSVYSRRPVTELLGQRLPVTLTLASLSFLVTCVIAIPLGVVAAVNRGRKIDRLATVFAVLALSVPEFWLALLLVLVFSVNLGWLPTSGWVSLLEDPVKAWRYLVLPVVTLGLVQAGIVTRITRSAMLEVMRQDYVRTARSKGLPERLTLTKHTLRNALLPIITTLGITLSVLLSGTIVIESMFNIPGLGRLAVFSISNRDYPMIQGLLLFTLLLMVAINLVVDLVYGLVDPRIQYQ